MQNKLKNILEKIAVPNEHRFDAITGVLNELGIKYNVQEESHEYEVPIYQKSKLRFHFLPPKREITVGEDITINREATDDSMEFLSLLRDSELMSMLPECGEMSSDEYEPIVTDNFAKHDRMSYAPRIIGYRKERFQVRNIVIPLHEGEKKLVFMAHYDAVPGSTGANDNGSAVAILIAFAQEVIGKATCMPMEIVFTDREETGAYGSRLYSKKHGNQILEVINLDTCGVGNDIITCDWSTHPSDITWRLIYGEPLNTLRPIITRSLPYCDADVMYNQGFPVIGICTLPVADARSIMSPHPSYKETYRYMHNGEFDDISYINYHVMEKIFRYLMLLV